MSARSDRGRALVPAVAGAAGADVIGGTATAIAKAESLQERRESHGGPQEDAQGEAHGGPRVQDGPQEDAQGDGEV